MKFWGNEGVSLGKLLPYGVSYLSSLGEYIFLSALVLPDAGGGAVHEPIRPQQGQDDIPHDGEVVTVAFVFEDEDVSVRDTGKVVDGKQGFLLSYVRPPVCGSSAPRRHCQGKFSHSFCDSSCCVVDHIISRLPNHIQINRRTGTNARCV